jgi:tRNA pseudouridine55 synthase
VVVDKPAGLSSAQTLARVKRLFKANKAGYAGTLDPFATGVMVCCLGQATRLSGFFLGGEKTYSGVMVLGVETDTQDATGRVIGSRPAADVDRAAIHAVMARFTGVIHQVPPSYSALKHQGVPLYRLARRGQPVVKAARPVEVIALKAAAIRLPEIDFTVTCTAGTYVRTLCHDIGRELGCGGHLKALRRLACSGFTIEEAATIDELTRMAAAGTLDRKRIGMADALRGMPTFCTDAKLALRIRHGQDISARDLPGARTGPVKMVDGAGRLLAVLNLTADGRVGYQCVFGVEKAAAASPASGCWQVS